MHKILICEDEQFLLDTLEDLIELRLSSCQITKATNGLDGFIAAQDEQFDLIITDHEMPFMRGAALIIALRTRLTKNKDTPVIMLSANIDDKMRQNLMVQNVKFIEKPFTPDDFIDVTRTYLI